MNMDRSQKNLESKKDDRTIEYLDLKYDTNIQRGLTLAKVRQKQRGKRSSRTSITKEKKRIWFMMEKTAGACEVYLEMLGERQKSCLL